MEAVRASVLLAWIDVRTPLIQFMSSGSVEVQESGRALKVHTETPHLVSLGGGRLSTAITLHPLPDGRTSVGSGPGADIVVQGTGVEAVHCYIDNHQGVVTLVPVGEMTSVDNLTASLPTRLTQGCMLCIGRSNYLRFNHPAEARMMKSAMPNSRISMLPYGFCPGDESSVYSVDGKPPAAPRRSWDSWEGLSSASSEEIARYISPKVFPAGSSTVNSPAALVLGPRAGHNKLSLAPLKLNGNIYQNVCSLPNGQFVPRDSPQSQSRTPSRVHSPSPPPPSPNPTSPRLHNIPSPAFDRNPSYPFRKSVTSPTPSWTNSAEDLKGESEIRRKQAESERLVEQECERVERQRLDEILMMCADYEKQAQWERQNKPQQNRIITNGSLPRDKRLPSPNSPHFHQSFTYDSESNPTSPDCDVKSNHFSRLTDTVKPESLDLSSPPPSSPRTRIRTIASKETTPSREYTLEVIENRLAIMNDYEILGPPPPPRKSSKNAITSPEFKAKTNNSKPTTSLSDSSCKNSAFSFNCDSQNVNNNNYNYSCKPSSISEKTALSKFEFFGFNPRTSQELKAQKSTESLISNGSRQRDSFQSTSTQTSVTKSTTKIENSPSWTSADFMAGKCNGDTIKRQEVKNGECTTEQLFRQLDAIVRESMKTCGDVQDREKMTPSPRSSERDSGIAEPAARDSTIVENNRDSGVIEMSRDSEKYILPLPDPSVRAETLRIERMQLVENLTELKAKVMDIEQQEDELMRELEIERALVGGELKAQAEKLENDERRVMALKERVSECEREMDNCVSQQAERQNQVKQRLEQQQQVLSRLEQQLQKCAEDSEMRGELLDSCRQQHELLEAERKSFEDLEFSLLEEEACWLSRREELQREVSEAMTRCAERRERLASLQSQREQAVKHATTSTKQLEAQLEELLNKSDQGRQRLVEIDLHLQSPNKQRHLDQEAEKKQSQDDIERISKVTSGAPIEMSSNSLGRRTIASLQEIERNRQLHLAKQGSLVIEEERKRVSELKRRVQDEARAEWEERRQRENNCHSLNSVGSEESSLTSSDMHTESASSEDAEKRLTSEANENHKIEKKPTSEDSTNQQVKRDEERKVEKQVESRPMSDASTYSEDQLTIRMRNKSTGNLQRPLTRYLPIRGEALDLRQHIEGAGHQVDLCPHVLLDKTSCRGFLHKMTSRFHNWNKRWFVFDRSRRTLTYFSDRSERKPRGGAYFQAIEEVYVDHSNGVKSPNPAVTFVIKSSERTYYLVAPSPEAMRIWVDVIFTGAEGYQEFAHGS